MRLFFLLFLTLLFSQSSNSQRRSGSLSDMTKEEIEAKRRNDSLQRYMDSFQANFSIKEYYDKLREIKRKNDTIQLNETLAFIREIEPKSDTIQSLTIQSSALSVFPESIKRFKNLKKLTLRRCQAIYLDDLFDKIQHLPLLTELNIIFSDKAKLPENIYKLKALQSLNLNGNNLNELPDSMRYMKRLEIINLHNNPILDPSQAFEILGDIKSLKHIQYTGSRMGVIPENIAQLNNIEYLDLSHNGISSIPESIEKLQNLKTLKLSRNTKLDALTSFARIAKNTSLEELDLSECSFTELPATIGTLVNIKKLNLWDNPIKKVSENIGNLSQLEELKMGTAFLNKERCELIELPKSLKNCSNLKHLTVKNAGLKSISKDLKSLQKLTYLDLSWNYLEDYPEFIGTLSQLKELNLNHNRISELPADFGRIKENLESLFLEANFYSSYHFKVKKLPQGLTALSNLKRLSLQDQVYESLPHDFFSSFPKMEYLNLSGALLSEIGDDISNMKNLKILILQANEITSISPDVTKLSKLQKLDISFNPDIEYASLLKLMPQMKNLKELNLSYNEIPNKLADDLMKKMKNTKIRKYELSDSPEYLRSRNRER